MNHLNKKLFLTALVDFMPVLVFIVMFELFNFFSATTGIIVATVLSLIIATFKEKRLPIFMLIMAILTFVFGYFTLHYHNSNLLKLKDTVFDFTSGTVLLLGYALFKRLVVKDFFKHVLHYTDKGWIWMTKVWVIYFYAGAILNETVRNIHGPHGDNLWVFFKIIHIPITIALGIFAVYYANKKYSLDLDLKNEDKLFVK